MRRGWLVSLLLVLAPVSAAAEDRADPAAYRDQAQVLREAGDRLYRARNYTAALERYRRAYDIFRSPMLLVSISAAAEMGNKPLEAAMALLQFFADPGDSVPLVRETAERNLARLLSALPPARLAELHREAKRRFTAEDWDRFPPAARDALPRPEAAQPVAQEATGRPAKAEPPRGSGKPIAAVNADTPPPPPQARAPRPPWKGPLPPAAPLPERRGGGLGTAKWTLGALGLLAAAGGAALLALDGRCTQPFLADGMELCKEELSTKLGGSLLLAGGGALLGTSAILFIVDYRRPRGGGETAMLTVSGRF